MKILIVDDVAFIRRILERLLVSHGFSVTTADSGESALDVLRRDHSIKAVLTDLHMPNMSGTDLFVEASKIERLTDEGTAPPPAFILLTAERGEKYLQLAMNLGFVQVLQKPPNEDQLVSQLEAIRFACQDAEETTRQPNAVSSPPALTCPFPTEETVLADDVISALDTLGEAIDALISFEDVDSLRQLQERIFPQLRHIEEGIGAFQSPQQQPLASYAGM